MGDRFTSGGLPDKEWYELEEVAERWSKMTGDNVAVKDVLHYGEIGILDICLKVNLGSWEVQIAGKYINDDKLATKYLISYEPYRVYFLREVFLATFPRDKIRELAEEDCISLDSILTERLYRGGRLAIDVKTNKIEEDFQLADYELFRLTKEDSIPWPLKGEDREKFHERFITGLIFLELSSAFFSESSNDPLPITFHLEDTFIPNEELKRFEREHSIGRPRIKPHEKPSKEDPTSNDPDKKSTKDRRRKFAEDVLNKLEQAYPDKFNRHDIEPPFEGFRLFLSDIEGNGLFDARSDTIRRDLKEILSVRHGTPGGISSERRSKLYMKLWKSADKLGDQA